MKPEKIDPGLLGALEDFHAEGKGMLLAHTRTLGVNAPVGRPPSAVVFLHCDPKAPLDKLQDSGVRINQRSGSVRTASVPLVLLEAVSDDPAVARIIGARYLRPLMDVAPGKVHVPTFHANTQLNGAGTIVGVVDTGIDARHPAFAGRILRIWDQTMPGPGVAEGAYGRELSGPLMTTSRDTVGHGTHVAGIAAGDDPTFGGIAPRADLVVVKSTLQDAHIADGIRYVFRVAGDLDRPVVVNLSLGGHADSHDGTDSLSAIVDAETGPGRIVCCAAGNEGNDNIHAQASVPANATPRRMRFRVPPNTIAVAEVNAWYGGANRLEVAVRTPGGYLTPFQPVISTGNPSQLHGLPDARVRITTPGPDPANNDVNFLVQLTGTSQVTPVRGGVWQLLLRNASGTAAVIDAWTLDDQHSPEVVWSGTSVRDSMKIGSPGAARSAVTVASYTTKTSWTDIQGQARQIGLTLDDISDFSSEGPLRNNARKPDVAAPGAMIVSALSSHSAPDPAEMISSDFVVMAGTSMATPFIAGLTALLLQRSRKLDPAGLKALLGGNSVIPGQPAGTFDPKWGFGLIDAIAL